MSTIQIPLFVILSVYGKEKYNKNASVQYGNKKVTAWVLSGFDTTQALRKHFTDVQILNLYSKQLAA